MANWPAAFRHGDIRRKADVIMTAGREGEVSVCLRVRLIPLGKRTFPLSLPH